MIGGSGHDVEIGEIEGVSPHCWHNLRKCASMLGDGAAAAHSITGAIYHLMSRGDRREEIFRDDLDREDFLKTLGAACQKLGGRSTPNRRRRSSSQQGSKNSVGEKENLPLDARATQ